MMMVVVSEPNDNKVNMDFMIIKIDPKSHFILSVFFQLRHNF